MEIEQEHSQDVISSLPHQNDIASEKPAETGEPMQSTQNIEVAKQLSAAVWDRLVKEIEILQKDIHKEPLFKFKWENKSTGKSNEAEIVFKDESRPILEIHGTKGMKTKNDALDLNSAPSVLAPNTIRIGPRFTTNKTVFKTRNIIWFFDFDENRLSLCTQAVPGMMNYGNKAKLTLDFDKSLIEERYSKAEGQKKGRAFRAELQLSIKDGEDKPELSNWKKILKNERAKIFTNSKTDEASFLEELFPVDAQSCIDKAYELRANGNSDGAVNTLFGVDVDKSDGSGRENIRKLAARVLWLLAARWITLLGAHGYMGDGEEYPDYIPSNEDLRVLRPVALKPPAVYEQLKKDGIYMPYSVVVSSCAALNAGKHIILTGPPGNGKTTLAKKLAVFAKKGDADAGKEGDYLLSVTASPSWTTAEMIGRYLPNPNPGNNGLEFIPGFYQEAIDDNKWLLIDEFNRADMDQCFGELFTVLSGQEVTLPFKRVRSDEEADAAEKVLEQVLLPKPPDDFRIIATMNDVDAGQLNTLSFALRRRFVILNIDVPDDSARKSIFKTRLERHKLNDSRNNMNPFYIVNSSPSSSPLPKLLKESLKKHLSLDDGSLFSGLFRAEGNLLDERIIGIAQATDMIDFIVESLRDPEAKSDDFSETAVSTLYLENHDILDLIASYTAMAVCLLIFPQLDACDDERFEKALQTLNAAFRTKSEKADSGEANAGKNMEFLLIQRDSADKYSVEPGKSATIAGYLKLELMRQFKFDSDRSQTIQSIFSATV